MDAICVERESLNAGGARLRIFVGLNLNHNRMSD